MAVIGTSLRSTQTALTSTGPFSGGLGASRPQPARRATTPSGAMMHSPSLARDIGNERIAVSPGEVSTTFRREL
jgi:hypothetical protein